MPVTSRFQADMSVMSCRERVPCAAGALVSYSRCSHASSRSVYSSSASANTTSASSCSDRRTERVQALLLNYVDEHNIYIYIYIYLYMHIQLL
jgi:hypothetical protein